MKRKMFLGISVFVFSLLIPLGAFALDTTTSESKIPLQLKDNRLKAAKDAAMDKIKEDAKTRITEQRTAFKEKVAAIKDERKKLLVERIDAKIAEKNANITTRFLNILEKLESILTRISDKASKAQAAGQDITTVEAALTKAKASILDVAKPAVEAQAIKEYTANITTDSALKVNVGRVVSQFRQDIKVVHKKIVDAKQAVMNAEKELAKVRLETVNTNQ